MKEAWYCSECGEKLAQTKEDIKNSSLFTKGCPTCGSKAAKRINITIASEYSSKKRKEWIESKKEEKNEKELAKKRQEEAKRITKVQKNWRNIVNRDKLKNPHLNIISENLSTHNNLLNVVRVLLYHLHNQKNINQDIDL